MVGAAVVVVGAAIVVVGAADVVAVGASVDVVGEVVVIVGVPVTLVGAVIVGASVELTLSRSPRTARILIIVLAMMENLTFSVHGIMSALLCAKCPIEAFQPFLA